MSRAQKEIAAKLREQLKLMGERSVEGNRDGFDDELEALFSIDRRIRSNVDEFFTGSLASSVAKNRFDDVRPNEGTRVRLSAVNQNGDGDYINANYIDGRKLFGVPFTYIATQAPLRNTCFDFWRMVFESNACFVCMLCAVREDGKVKSECYWPPEGESHDYGPLSVATLRENRRSDTVYRTIRLRAVDGRERSVFHMQFTAWPDQGIPPSSSPLMDMIQTMGRSPESVGYPIVVHCSGGVGRTGVFIALHVGLALFQFEKLVNVPEIVQYLKMCRTGMVQRKDQYLFLYYALLREMERMIRSAEKGGAAVDALPPGGPGGAGGPRGGAGTGPLQASAEPHGRGGRAPALSINQNSSSLSMAHGDGRAKASPSTPGRGWAARGPARPPAAWDQRRYLEEYLQATTPNRLAHSTSYGGGGAPAAPPPPRSPSSPGKYIWSSWFSKNGGFGSSSPPRHVPPAGMAGGDGHGHGCGPGAAPTGGAGYALIPMGPPATSVDEELRIMQERNRRMRFSPSRLPRYDAPSQHDGAAGSGAEAGPHHPQSSVAPNGNSDRGRGGGGMSASPTESLVYPNRGEGRGGIQDSYPPTANERDLLSAMTISVTPQEAPATEGGTHEVSPRADASMFDSDGSGRDTQAQHVTYTSHHHRGPPSTSHRTPASSERSASNLLAEGHAEGRRTASPSLSLAGTASRRSNQSFPNGDDAMANSAGISKAEFDRL